jgi:hypothetical protein
MPKKEKPPEPVRDESEEKGAAASRRLHWAWPLGLAVAGLGGAAAFMLRGCWHSKMSWPTSYDEDFSYQVCPSCGIKRLFDPATFHAYGPYGYDLQELIACERAERARRLEQYKKRAEREPSPKEPAKE